MIVSKNYFFIYSQKEYFFFLKNIFKVLQLSQVLSPRANLFQSITEDKKKNTKIMMKFVEQNIIWVSSGVWLIFDGY